MRVEAERAVRLTAALEDLAGVEMVGMDVVMGQDQSHLQLLALQIQAVAVAVEAQQRRLPLAVLGS